MKFVTYINEGKSAVGVLNAAETAVIPASELGLKAQSMNELIDELNGSLPAVPSGANELPLDTLKLDAPIPEPKQDVICLGLNYRDHAEESLSRPLVFCSFSALRASMASRPPCSSIQSVTRRLM